MLSVWAGIIQFSRQQAIVFSIWCVMYRVWQICLEELAGIYVQFVKQVPLLASYRSEK